MAQLTLSQVAHQQTSFKEEKDGVRIPCPAHGGEDLNCKIWEREDGTIWAHCWSHRCDPKDILAALNISNENSSPPPSQQRENPSNNKPSTSRKPIAVYQHPDGNPRPVYRTDHNGPCARDNCSKDDPHKHIWGPGSPKGCYLLSWGPDDIKNALVLVEGEKAALALKNHLAVTKTKGYTPVSWRGGTSAAGNANYELCKDRIVICWPDNDEVGRKAMKAASEQAVVTGATSILGIPTTGSDGRDAADLSAEQSLTLLKKAVRVKVEKARGRQVEDSPEGLETAMENSNTTVWYNEREGSFYTLTSPDQPTILEYKDVERMKVIDDNARAALRVQVSKNFVFERRSGNDVYYKPAYFTEDKFSTTLRAQGNTNGFDPVKVWLESLPAWDDQPRIEPLLDTLFEANDPGLAAWAGRAIFIGGVTRTYEPGAIYDRYPILVGRQELTKSATLSALVPDHRWYTDSLDAGADEKTTIERAGSSLIVEFSELAGIRKWELERLKKFLSKTHDRARRAWGRETTDMPRRWVGVGTANPQSYGILPNDETGNRRFTVIAMSPRKFDFQDILHALTQNRDQIWAEALQKYRQAKNTGYNPALLYRLSDELKPASEKVVRSYVIRDEHAYDIALKATETFIIQGSTHSMEQILANYDVFTIEESGEKMTLHRRLATDVGQELRGLGWERDDRPRSIKGVKKRWWSPPKEFIE